jgi:hypothetical protein
MQRNRTTSIWLIACIYGAGLLLAGVLLIQHWVHLPAVLPYLILLACPLMHVFMHGRHGHAHNNHANRPKADTR